MGREDITTRLVRTKANGSETQGKMLHSVAPGWLCRQRERILSIA
jgi:hypothetical protein